MVRSLQVSACKWFAETLTDYVLFHCLLKKTENTVSINQVSTMQK